MPIRQAIQVRYSCTCGLNDQLVTVQARQEEAVEAWMLMLQAALGQDHSSRSPMCAARAVINVKVPVEGADRIGGLNVGYKEGSGVG